MWCSLLEDQPEFIEKHKNYPNVSGLIRLIWKMSAPNSNNVDIRPTDVKPSLRVEFANIPHQSIWNTGG